jgi:hypothetical protein
MRRYLDPVLMHNIAGVDALVEEKQCELHNGYTDSGPPDWDSHDITSHVSNCRSSHGYVAHL